MHGGGGGANGGDIDIGGDGLSYGKANKVKPFSW
jgi:hypothetical protein